MSCVIEGCKSHTGRKENDNEALSFHRFPKNEEIKNEWIRRARRSNWTWKKRSHICSKHFTPDSFVPNENLKWRRLKADALPTLYLSDTDTLEGINIQSNESPCTSNSQAQKSNRTESPLRDITYDSENIPMEVDVTVAANTSTEVLFTKRLRLEQSTALGHAVTVDNELERVKAELECSKKRLFKMTDIAKRRLRKINALKQKTRRMRNKNISFNSVLDILLKNEDINREQLLILESLKSNELIKRFAIKTQGDPLPREYSLELKKFAVTLHFLSPKAYNFVRNEFKHVLPHPKTISSWYKGIDCEPGFTSEALEAIKLRVQNQGKVLYCALIIDEMSIRKLIEWDGRKYYGYVNIGCELESDSIPMAKEALTFMVTSVNDTWKIPVGYFLINSITATQKATLIEQCISLLKETGIIVISLTYDGATTNIAMANSLCGNLSNQTRFRCKGFEICMWPDPCHNIKLVRNTLGERKKLIDGQGKIISWDFIERLHKIQQEEQLHLGTKLRKDHVEYVKQKMKVRLATQLLSESVADALQFCKDLKLPEFAEAEGTITFIRVFNNLFDIMNSRNMRAKGWKRATASFNFPEIEVFFEFASIYIKQLKFEDGVYVVNSNRKTGFVGFLTCMESLKYLFLSIVADQNSPLSYLCTYKLNQDHVELFFGAIRSLGGFNNNPSARMYQAAYKKLLVHAQFKNGSSGNCLPLENITVLNFSPKKIIDVSRVELFNEREEEEFVFNIDHDYVPQPNMLTEYSMHVIKYIAGFVVRKIKIRLTCEVCLDSLETIEDKTKLSLISIKNRGGLIYPSIEVIKVCELTEKNLRIWDTKKKIGTPRNMQNMIFAVVKKLAQTKIFEKLADHCLEQDITFGDDHRHLLIKSIAHLYLVIRIHYITKSLSVPVEKIRNFLTKTILFKGQ